MSQAQVSSLNGSLAGGSAAVAAGLASIVYRSRAVRPLSEADLYRLTMDSQSRNNRESITGLMLYDDTRFFQWLEGPTENLDRVMQSIRNDRRHTDIEILSERAAPKRVFGAWSMKLAARTGSREGARWGDEVMDAPAELVADLRERPDTAAAVLIKLVPQAGEMAAPLEDVFGRKALAGPVAAVLKGVMLSTVIPNLAVRHGIRARDAAEARSNERVAELADLLIGADQTAARALIEEMQAGGEGVNALFPGLLEPAARRLGDLWAEDFCSEFEVTLGLCRIQSAARLLRAGPGDGVASGRAKGSAVLIAPEPGELHQLGAALDSEVLWRAGWAPHCEYAADGRTLQELVSSQWFDAVDLSLSAAFHREDWLPRLTRTITDVRRMSRNPDLLVVVGGRVFVDGRATSAAVGADVASLSAFDVDALLAGGLARVRAERVEG